jgi:hypothetical protein
MRFIKASFKIQMNEKHGFAIEDRDGWIDESKTFGFYKSQGGWIATDLKSGSSIVWRKTRKACAQWIEENEQILNETFSSDGYNKSVFDFEKRKEG